MAKPFTALRDSRLGLDDVLPFGRHQGYTVEEILKDRPEYISWLMSNTTLKFYPSVHELLLLMKPKRVPQHTSFNPKYSGKSYDFIIYDELFDDIPF
jgi:hypothetical protein